MEGMLLHILRAESVSIIPTIYCEFNWLYVCDQRSVMSEKSSGREPSELQNSLLFIRSLLGIIGDGNGRHTYNGQCCRCGMASRMDWIVAAEKALFVWPVRLVVTKCQ